MRGSLPPDARWIVRANADGAPLLLNGLDALLERLRVTPEHELLLRQCDDGTHVAHGASVHLHDEAALMLLRPLGARAGTGRDAAAFESVMRSSGPAPPRAVTGDGAWPGFFEAPSGLRLDDDFDPHVIDRVRARLETVEHKRQTEGAARDHALLVATAQVLTYRDPLLVRAWIEVSRAPSA